CRGPGHRPKLVGRVRRHRRGRRLPRGTGFRGTRSGPDATASGVLRTGWIADAGWSRTMKLTIDPYMFRHLSLRDMVRSVAEIGYEYIELSPREDFMPFFLHPRADRARVAELKSALRETGVQLSSLLPLYRWSGPDEDARQAAVRYWKRAIELAVELDCQVMNSEFNGRPERAA